MTEANGSRQATPRPKAPSKRPAAGRTAKTDSPARKRKAGPAGKGSVGLNGALSSVKALWSRAASRKKAQPSGDKGKPKKRTSLLRSKFYRVYFILLALAAIGIAAGTAWLNGVLADYESAQPVYVAEEVVKIFEDGDFTSLYTMDSSARDIAGDDQSFYEETMRGIVTGKDISWNEAFSTNEDERRYTVSVGGDRFATFTLVPSGETTRHGNRLWQLGTLDTNVVTETELDETLGERIDFRITAPEKYTVTVDGEALTAENAVRTGIISLPKGFLPSGVEEPSLTQYAFTSRNAQPQIVVTDPSGSVQTLREDGENAWKCGPEDDPALREQVTDGVVGLAKLLAKFTSKDASQHDLLRNVADDSPAYTIIKKFSNYWAPTHKDCEFSNMVVSDCIRYSDNCFTCHVSFDFLLRTRRGTEMTYPTAYTFCIIKKSGKAKLYNLTMN